MAVFESQQRAVYKYVKANYDRMERTQSKPMPLPWEKRDDKAFKLGINPA